MKVSLCGGAFFLYGVDMDFSLQESLDRRNEADALVIPFWNNEGVLEIASSNKDYQDVVNPIIDLGDFSAKSQEVAVFYTATPKEPRLLLLGLGEKKDLSLEGVRRSYAEAVKLAMNKKWKSLNLLSPLCVEYSEDQMAHTIAESVFLTNYSFDYLGKKIAQKKELLKSVNLITRASFPLNELKAISTSINLTRDLVNGNADLVTPKYIVEQVKALNKKHPELKVTIWDKHQIIKHGMGLLYAVARASSEEPYFVVVEYHGNPKSSDHTVLVGKGITYDTGGLSLKPTASMDSMKCDMAGAATVLSTLAAVAELKMKINCSCVIATTENSIDALSYKLGDVYTGYSGVTVEIKNTDAEGRLILADCLAYANAHLKPTRMIDLATLTGAAMVALGDHKSALFSNDDSLARELYTAGEMVGERLWRMPLDPDYKDLISSSIADIKNCGAREGSLIFSAMFLQEFAGETPWAHLDIAGPAFLEKPRFYHTTPATGYGVRLLIQFLKGYVAK